jgi:hypothetical protein
MDNPQPRPDHLTDAVLLARQASLQARAGEVLEDLDLVRVLGAIGEVMLVGSVRTGLMTWPDIDVNVLCHVPDPDAIWAGMRPLASHPRVRKLRWSNESGGFSTHADPGDHGYYVGIHYYDDGTRAGEMWKIDCWFLRDDPPRPEVAQIDRLHRDLTDETRLAILRVKDAWCHHPSYRDTVLSVDIYDAVLDHGIRTPEAFRAWLHARGKA